MNDKFRIPQRPERKPPVASLDELVTGKAAKPKRLTIDVDPDLHQRAKIGAAKRGKPLAEIINKFLEGEFPKE